MNLIVVGAGIVGAAIAYESAKAGVRVTLIDRESVRRYRELLAAASGR
jgi:glycine/D-amino acid oxidase-like deaminating enzyme